MAEYLPVRSVSRSQSVRIGTQRITKNTTTYVDISLPSVRRDVERHSAIGALLVVGPLTASNSHGAVISGGVVTNGSGLSVNVSAGEIRNRDTGATLAGVAGTNFALTVANGSQDRTDLIWWDLSTGAVGKTDGDLAAPGQSVAKAATSGQVALATVLVAAAASTPGTKTDIRPRL